jgi:hypothetical protein
VKDGVHLISRNAKDLTRDYPPVAAAIAQMSAPRRGGRRPRHLPSGVPVSSSGRWGPRRTRVHECWSILRAEAVYDQFLREHVALKPGWRATVRVLIPIEDSKAVHPWSFEVEVLPNRVWRRGRLFCRCPACGRRATRLYVPLSGLQPRCRRCWGLSYESKSWSYGLYAPAAYVTTLCRREERQRAARARYDARRAFLVKPA